MLFSKFKILDTEKETECQQSVNVDLQSYEKFKVSSDVNIELTDDLYCNTQNTERLLDSNIGISGYSGVSGLSDPDRGISGYSGVFDYRGVSGFSGVHYESLLRRFLQIVSISELPQLDIVRAVTIDTVRYDSVQNLDCQVREYNNTSTIGTVFFNCHTDVFSNEFGFNTVIQRQDRIRILNLEDKLFVALLRSQQPLHFFNVLDVSHISLINVTQILSDYGHQFSYLFCHPSHSNVFQSNNLVTSTLLDENEVYILSRANELGVVVLINNIVTNSTMFNDRNVLRLNTYENIGVIMANSFVKIRING